MRAFCSIEEVLMLSTCKSGRGSKVLVSRGLRLEFLRSIREEVKQFRLCIKRVSRPQTSNKILDLISGVHKRCKEHEIPNSSGFFVELFWTSERWGRWLMPKGRCLEQSSSCFESMVLPSRIQRGRHRASALQVHANH